jgi:Protein of unknown function (DUF4235)
MSTRLVWLGLTALVWGRFGAMKILFAPVGIAAGLVAGFVAKKAFEKAWAVIDDEEPPEPDERFAPTGKMIAALALEGAIFRVTKGFVDHKARAGFAGATGRWPGTDPTKEDD